MVTNAQTPIKSAAPKVKRETIALTARITTQLDRAVLGKKVSKEELSALSEHITKLQAFIG